MRARQQPQCPRRFWSLTPTHQPDLVALPYAGLHNPKRWRRQRCDLAAASDLTVQACQARPFRLRIMLVDCLRDDRLDAGAQPLRPRRAVPRQEHGDVASDRLCLPQQHPNAPGLETEFCRDCGHIIPGSRWKTDQRRQKIAPARSLGPLRVGAAALVDATVRAASVPGRREANARRLRGNGLARLVEQNDGVGAEHLEHAPALAAMFDLDARNETSLHAASL